MRSVTLDSSNGSFRDLASLSECLRASMLLPGMAGPVVHLPLWGAPSGGPPASEGLGRGPLPQLLPVVSSCALPRFAPEAPKAVVSEPLADALLFEPVPYRTAVESGGASHVLVLRSRPDKRVVGRLKGIEAAVSH